LEKESNNRAQQIVHHWPESYRTYTTHATPWLLTGDSQTGIPFLINQVKSPKWIRVWLPLSDGEVVALDISFPKHGYDKTKPIYLVLHGLNGGSNEAYVKDLTIRRNEQDGATVIVMITRGLMDLPIRSFNVFHGARWEDAHQAATTIRKALLPGQILAGVGYSMGAIILSNMVTRTGTDCALDVAVAISGGLDMRQMIDFSRAQRLWQPLILAKLRDDFAIGKWGERHRLTKSQMRELMRATYVTDFDRTAVIAYGFRDIIHYYSEMSALGDVPYPSDEYSGSVLPSSRRM
jgi:predicted alpha/beta-fold hydrolase